MQSNKLRVGVVGLGWAGETHLRCYKQLPQVEVVALTDPRDTHLAKVGDAHGIENLYLDYHDMLARDDLDIVSVATPNYLHAPVSIAALERGLHVLCEKPLARTAAEAESMVEAARSAGRVLKTAFNHRERGAVTTLKRYIDAGEMGQIYHAKAFWQRRNGIPGMGGWFTTMELAGGGPLIDLGVHVLDMALYLMGEPRIVSVSGAIYAELGKRGKGGRAGDTKVSGTGSYDVEDLALAFIRLEDGKTLQLEAAWAMYRENNDTFGVALFGTDGGAQIKFVNYDHHNSLAIYADVAGAPADIYPVVEPGDMHMGTIRDFVHVIESGDWSGHIGLEGLRRARIIDACYQSAREGREIAIKDHD